MQFLDIMQKFIDKMKLILSVWVHDIFFTKVEIFSVLGLRIFHLKYLNIIDLNYSEKKSTLTNYLN